MKVILPSAGYATRMYPLTLDKPKALLQVGEKAIIDYIVESVCKINEVDEIIVVTNAKFYDKFLEWSKSFDCKIRVKVLNDGTNNSEERLGAVGDINFVLEKEKIDDDFIVVNSDNLFTFDLLKMYENFKKNGNNIVSIYDVGDLNVARRMGNPRIDENNKIIYFKEKNQSTVSTLCSIGIYFFKREIILMIKKYLIEGNSGDRPGDFLEWLYKERDIYGHLFDSNLYEWFDIGDIETYEKVREKWNN
jgi:glucose-1-phosphate thymidylyltransferase